MRTIIAGGRDFVDYAAMKAAMAKVPWRPTVVISGMARGADKMGVRWAWDNGRVPVEPFPADWDGRGMAAGPERNERMAQAAEALVAFPMPQSVGTRDMIDRALARGLRVVVFEVGADGMVGEAECGLCRYPPHEGETCGQAEDRLRLVGS